MRGRWRKWCFFAALLLACAVCCAGPMTTMMSAASSGNGSGGNIAGEAAGIADRVLAAYKSAAITVTQFVPGCRGMRWPVLAGVARIESHNAEGRAIALSGDTTPHIVGPRLDGSGAGGNTTTVKDTDNGEWDGDGAYDRAVGPFQFLPSTFRVYGKDGNGDHKVDPHNADDAALAAAVYLCGEGRNLFDNDQLRSALLAYNHSDAYVDDVMMWISHYDFLVFAPDPLGIGGDDLTGDVATVVHAAMRQEGMPYSWGGGNASGPSKGICCSPGGQDGRTVVGFDCSGLTLYAFAQAGVTLPRTAAAQAAVGTRIAASAGYGALEPGDLVLYGYIPTQKSTIHHVGIYIGDGYMINAPRPGTTVRIDPVTSMSDFAGGARIL